MVITGAQEASEEGLGAAWHKDTEQCVFRVIASFVIPKLGQVTYAFVDRPMRLRHLLRTFVLAAALAMAACASKSEDITASYVSPVTYEAYSCTQLSEEAQRVSSRAAQAAGVQDEKARNDKIATAATIVIFWPAAFFISGNGANAAEVARLKGQMDAIEEAGIKKRCGFDIRRS